MASVVAQWLGGEVVTQIELVSQVTQDTSVKEVDWKTKICDFLQQGKLPSDTSQALRVKRRASHFTLVGDMLYKRAYSRPLLKCLDRHEADYVLREIHEGSGRSLARKVLLARYFWPTLDKDAANLVTTCLSCQRHQNLSHHPTDFLQLVTTSYPFDQWGMKIIGPFPRSPSQKRFLLVAVDYFSKWIEAEALSPITERVVLQFLWKNIICRYEIPRRLISDNEK